MRAPLAWWFVPALLSVLSLGRMGPQALAAEPADLVLRGGVVLTLEDDLPRAEALAVKGGRIVAVGSPRQIAAWTGPSTRIIELEGRAVLPGFIEGHGHFFSLGAARQQLDLASAESWEEVVARVAEAARRTPAGQWIVGRGWHQGKWRQPPTKHVQGYPVHDDLSRLTPDHPVLLRHGTGHMLLANRRAMELAGIDRLPDQPIAGGEILRDEAGRPTGVFREQAGRLIERVYDISQQQRTADERRAVLRAQALLAAEECLRYGVTSFQDAGASLTELEVLEALAEAGQLPVRLWVMLDGGNAVLRRSLPRVRRVEAANGFLTVRAIKRLADGALGTHGAWLLAPYDDLPGSLGNNTLPLAELEETAELALAHGMQLCVHAIGDRANREVLDLFERVWERHGVEGRELRWRIEHAQHLDPADIPRLARLGVIASMQASHATADGPFVVSRLGLRRARLGAYAWRSLLDSGALVINGSDVPVEPLDPRVSLAASVTRRMASGEAFFPEQCMTRREALLSYTRWAAYAAFEESVKGTLAPGKYADLVVLNHDPTTLPPDAWPKLRVQMTIVGGNVAWQAPEEQP
jgi:predicted amidohydrolase YtcJ